MVVIKCKMCGGDLQVIEGSTVCECEYCGSRQTIPTMDNEKKMTLFTRASRLLRNCEFDKASGVFEAIVADFPEEAEAYWGLVLCKYGIEYVDDPATGKKVPTCHRSSFDNVLDDSNFEQACENADAVARRVYRDEARTIEELRKGIIEVSGKEEPYDIFISYKETDENGERTLDSVIAQDIYRELTDDGYRVFFSRISLESKLGTEFEPYIFAALNSAKVMIVVGTDYENFDAVWVKNEWSRFLKLISSGQKKTLIPVFKNMDAYDMPKEFAKLSAQDMGKVGAMQDLVRGVEKLIPKKKQETVQVEKVTEKVIVQQQSESSMKTDAAIKRGKLALEDGEWEKAKQYFDQALTLDAECAEAYFGIALAELQARDPESYIGSATSQIPKTEKLSIPEDTAHIRKAAVENSVKGFLSESEITPLYRCDLSYSSTLKGQQEIQTQVRQQIESNRNISRALRFATGEEKVRIEGFKNTLYSRLKENVEKARKQEEENRNRVKQNYEKFLKEADEKTHNLNREACAKQAKAYQNAVSLQGKAKSISEYQAAIAELKKTPGFQDTTTRIQLCEKAISDIQEWERREQEEERRKQEEQSKITTAKKKRITAILCVLAVLTVAGFFVVTKVVIPEQQRNAAYQEAASLYASEDYAGAYKKYLTLTGYKDVDTLMSTDINLIAAAEAAREAKLKPYKTVGGIVGFGTYEQDNNIGNGKETIEWIVLKNEGNQSLLITRYALVYMKYNTEYENITWETCFLRSWLNSTFLNAAFSTGEQSGIMKTSVDNGESQGINNSSTTGGNNTTDQIFLLSYAEAQSLFRDDSDRSCKPTAYADRNIDRIDGGCAWWLRSPGDEYQSSAAEVDGSGSLGDSSNIINARAVRPALWINLESEFFNIGTN